MHQSINKKKIYFYLFIFLFLSTIFNFNLSKKLEEIILINKINIEGISQKEKKLVKKEVNNFINYNIFFINKDQFLQKLSKFNFFDNVKVQKILPSKINIFFEKTNFLGLSIINGKKFYIGNNGKFTLAEKVEIEKNLPMIYGKFQINDFLNLQNILKSEKIDIKQITEYYYYNNKRWDLKKNGLIIKLPPKNIKTSLNIYKKLADKNRLNQTKIIDLRISNQIIITDEAK